MIEIKKYFVRVIIFMVGFTIAYLLLDFITGEMQSFHEYVVHAVILGVLVGVGWYLNDKGWNSWKKIGSLLKCNKGDN